MKKIQLVKKGPTHPEQNRPLAACNSLINLVKNITKLLLINQSQLKG